MRSEALDATGPGGLTLRIEFIWRVDRFGHVISIVGPTGETVPLLESIEGASADDWPPSPPLQTLRLETLPDGRRAALLVGMAGRSHWSASVEAAAHKAELVFDVACRHATPPHWLGNSYRALSGTAAEFGASAESPTVFLRLPGSPLLLTVGPDRSRIKPLVPLDAAAIVIEPLELGPASATTRWKFVVSLDQRSSTQY